MVGLWDFCFDCISEGRQCRYRGTVPIGAGKGTRGVVGSGASLPRFRGCIEICNAIFVQRQTWCFLPSEDAMGNQPYLLKQKLNVIWTKQAFNLLKESAQDSRGRLPSKADQSSMPGRWLDDCPTPQFQPKVSGPQRPPGRLDVTPTGYRSRPCTCGKRKRKRGISSVSRFLRLLYYRTDQPSWPAPVAVLQPSKNCLQLPLVRRCWRFGTAG